MPVPLDSHIVDIEPLGVSEQNRRGVGSLGRMDGEQLGLIPLGFNTFVEQCIAVDDPEDARGASSDEDDEDDDSSSDGVLEIKSASSISSRSSRSSRPSLSRHSSASSDHVTIAKIAPTMLKTSDFPSPV